MKTKNKFVVALMIGLLGSVFCTSAEAAIRVYKVSFASRGTLYPKKVPTGGTLILRGYMVVETTDPSQAVNFATITLYPGKKYSTTGELGTVLRRQVMNPFNAINTKSGGLLDTFVMFEAGEVSSRHYAGMYRGNIPRKGFKLAGASFTDEARILRYQGSAVGLNVDLLRRKGTFRLDPITVTDPQMTVADQLAALVTFLENKGYSP